MASPFEILGISPDADDEEIERAYRRRVIEAHPDQGGSASEFRLVRAAYEEIQAGGGVARRAIDGRRSAGPGAAEPGGGSDGRAGGRTERDDRTGGRADARERGADAGGERSDGRTERDGRERGTAEGAERGGGDGDADAEREGSTIEYLNYEALGDHGWELGDEDLFEKAAAAGLDPEDYGRFLVKPDEYLLEAAENRGFAWPYACRGGACANCAVLIVEGEMETPGNHILTPNLIERDIRLSCMSSPTTDEMKVVYNVKHLPGLDELRLPPNRFERAHYND